MTNYLQGTIKKQCQQQLEVPPHKQTLLRNEYIEEKYFTFFLYRNVLPTNVFLINSLIKGSQLYHFINKYMIALKFCKQALIHFKRLLEFTITSTVLTTAEDRKIVGSLIFFLDSSAKKYFDTQNFST